ncbi:KptA family-domain-containing protein [Vararia minispora EC-137]|uniref:KptA family-domain-containing protein n=1 Tax=Vararia minispora EC-137 TaxID=1314806 RepID=A0ACB8QEP0_9AGAM|nr:KptA family-domain-containing protein [Vararia minispora EC-137]
MSNSTQSTKLGGGGRGRGGRGGGKLRGRTNDSPEVKLSKTLSWLLRHGAQSEGLPMREDGYVRVDDLLATPKLRAQRLDLTQLQNIVAADAKQRYSLVSEPGADGAAEAWWIRANQGHSMSDVKMDLKPILAAKDVPMAVHGTNMQAWKLIEQNGLSRMTRNHIHLAQGVPGDGVISGMRTSAQVLIYIDLQCALDAGLRFYLSDNGVVLTEGDDKGVVHSRFFSRVTDKHGDPLAGWTPAAEEST